MAPLDFEPYSPGPTQAEAADALARYCDERTQIDSVTRVQRSFATLVTIIRGTDFPLGSPFVGLEIEQVIDMLQAGGDCWPLQQPELDAAHAKLRRDLLVRVVS